MARKRTSTRAKDKTQISISLPQDLVGTIDKLAALENRNRSNFISTHLEQLTKGYEAAEPAVEFKARKK